MRHKILTATSALPDDFYLEIYKQSVVEIDHFKQIYGPSGKRWRWFIDAKSTLMQQRFSKPIAKIFALAAKRMGADYVATMGYGAAAIIGSITTYSDSLDGLIIRSDSKKYGNDRDIIGPIPKGKKVVMIDDLINSGKSALQMANLLRQEGAEVIGMLSVFEFYNSKGREKLANEDIELVSLAKLENTGNPLPKAIEIVKDENFQIEEFYS